MGGLSIWHWLITAVFFIGLVLLIVRAVARPRSDVNATTPRSGESPSRYASTEQRLQDLAALKSKGLITEPEYDRQRAEIIRGV